MIRKIILLLFLMLFVVVGLSVADEYVRGYTKSNGTYVAPYYRSSPDSSYNNNWSVSPNTNPYTGEQGKKSPTWDDKPPSNNNSIYDNPYDNSRSTRKRNQW